MIKKNNNSKHEFALYLPQTTELTNSHKTDDLLSLHQPQLYHRITNVLRLSTGESFVIFNQTHHIQCQLQTCDKKNVLNIRLISIKSNQILSPDIIFFLPLLKREAFQEAIYSLTELGATTIAPIITQKVQRTWGEHRERERLERIIHAAAEQSKNFAFPTLMPPQSLEQMLTTLRPTTEHIYFDPDGKPLLNIVQELKKRELQELVLMIGPEADLAPEEKKLLHQHQFNFCRLTPTILRAQQAAAVSLGIFRSIFS